MQLKELVVYFSFLASAISNSPIHACEILSCEGFDSCPANCAPVNVALELQNEVERLEAENAELQAQIEEMGPPHVLVTAEFFPPNGATATCPDGTSVVTGGISTETESTCHWEQVFGFEHAEGGSPYYYVEIDFASEIDPINNRVNCEYVFGYGGTNASHTPTGDWSGCKCVAVCR